MIQAFNVVAYLYLSKKEYKLVDYYTDDGHSGTNFDRLEFRRMLEDIKN